MARAEWDERGQWLAVATADHRLKLWDVQTSQVTLEYAPPDHLTRRITALAWARLPRPASEKRKRAVADTKSAQTQAIVLGLEDGTVLVISVAKGDLALTLQGGHTRRVNAIAGRADGSTLFSAGDDGLVIQWNLATGAEASRFVGDKKGVHALQLNHANTVLAVAGHAIRHFDVADGRLLQPPRRAWARGTPVQRYTGHATPVRSMAFHPGDGSIVSGAGQDRFLNVWRAAAAGAATSDVAEGALAALVMDSEPVVVDIVANGTAAADDFSGRGLCVLAVGEDGRLYLWESPTVPAAAGGAGGRAGKSAVAAAGSIPARSTIAFVAAVRKPGKAKAGKPVTGGAAVRLPVVTARFLAPAVPGAAPRVLVARGSLVKPTFETVDIFPEDQTAMVEGALEWTRKADAGMLLPEDATAEAASNGTTAPGPRVLGPGDMMLPAPQLATTAEDATLAERLQQLDVLGTAGGKAAAGRSPKAETSRAKTVAAVRRGARTAAAPTRPAAAAPGGRPSAESLQVMLSQALRTDDRALLEQCLAVQDHAIVRATVRRLPTQQVLPFLKTIIHRFQLRPNRGITLAVWIRAVLTIHTAYLMTIPDLPYKLSGLYQVVDHRLAVFKRLLSLAGRLDLIMAQVAQRQEMEPAQEVAPTIFYDGSDDEAHAAAGTGDDADMADEGDAPTGDDGEAGGSDMDGANEDGDMYADDDDDDDE